MNERIFDREGSQRFPGGAVKPALGQRAAAPTPPPAAAAWPHPTFTLPPEEVEPPSGQPL